MTTLNVNEASDFEIDSVALRTDKTLVRSILGDPLSFEIESPQECWFYEQTEVFFLGDTVCGVRGARLSQNEKFILSEGDSSDIALSLLGKEFSVKTGEDRISADVDEKVRRVHLLWLNCR